MQLLLTSDDNQTVVTLGAGLAAPMAEGEDEVESDGLEAEAGSTLRVFGIVYEEGITTRTPQADPDPALIGMVGYKILSSQ